MKNKSIQVLAIGFVILIFSAPWAYAKSAIVGDIILLGDVQRSGQKLINDASVFEGDSIRTGKGSGGVLRVGEGRVEIGESSEIEVVRQNPLKIVLKAGTLAVNFPKGTPLEIVTPQMEVHPSSGEKNISAIINAAPQTEDRFQSRSGDFTVLERQKNGKTSHIMAGQIIVAALLPAAVAVSPGALEPIPPPQGPIVGPVIATLKKVAGDVRLARAAAPTNFARVIADTQLATNDFLRTLNGRAEVQFSDNSVIDLIEGTTIRVQQQMMANTITRRISQYVGSIWFNITRGTGTQTTLETPTAVAAIRGTQGTQDVPNDSQSTHALNEGLEQVTENVTSQSVTLRPGQQVTAIRGVGFGTILSLTAAIAQPLIATNVPAAPGQGQGGGLTAQGTGIATTSTITTIAAITATAVAVTAGVVAAIIPVTVRKTPPADNTSPTPLNPPGGG